MISLRSGAGTSHLARWAVPAGVLAAVGAGAVAVQGVSSASAPLPPRSAAQLLADVSRAGSHPFSGTVVETARLGLPSLPSKDSGGTSLASLVTGSHTAKVWYAGPDRVRVALVGSLAETDVIRNGRDVWQWTSGPNTATHSVLPARPGEAAPPSSAADMTPQQLAARALAAVNACTRVSVDGTATVAGRSAYELVLQPRDKRSLVGQVRIAVDSKVSVPLRVRVYASGRTTPALEVGFTAVRFATPAADLFRFRPPKGATVTGPTAGTAARATPRAGTAPSGSEPTRVGTGWTAVIVARNVHVADSQDGAAQALLRGTTPVSGAYGSGRLLRTALVSALLLDDGRLLVGAVTPEVLTAAAADPAARR